MKKKMKGDVKNEIGYIRNEKKWKKGVKDKK
jgi:hypothetical protein